MVAHREVLCHALLAAPYLQQLPIQLHTPGVVQPWANSSNTEATWLSQGVLLLLHAVLDTLPITESS
jgi:hypothetical protein